MGAIQDISIGLIDPEYVPSVDESRGVQLQEELEKICRGLAQVGNITEGKADVEFILGIVAAYLISKENDKLPEDSKPPSYIFDENLFPMLDNYEETTEEIKDEDGSTSDT